MKVFNQTLFIYKRLWTTMVTKLMRKTQVKRCLGFLLSKTRVKDWIDEVKLFWVYLAAS